MKRMLLIVVAVVMSTLLCSASMSSSRVRLETRFLTDKMAHELHLNMTQYNDVYEINFDFIWGVRKLLDDVIDGERWALERYYDYLDMRNDDLRWVLNRHQYRSFMRAAHFFRPIYVTGGHWHFRVYRNYSNRNHFYFPKPKHYHSYCGGHHRSKFDHKSHYRGRYKQPHYEGNCRIRGGKSYTTSLRADFGPVQIRIDSEKRPDGPRREVRRKHQRDDDKRKWNQRRKHRVSRDNDDDDDDD